MRVEKEGVEREREREIVERSASIERESREEVRVEKERVEKACE